MVAGDFWRAADLWKQQMELAYQMIESIGVAAMDPDEAPPGVALKMENSTFCQAWLPHLSAEDGERLLAYYGVQGDYTKVEPQVTEDHRCGSCGVELQTVPGARVVVCEDCGRQVDIAAGAVPCRQCGAPLSYPVGVTELTCPYCHTATARV
jgi:LSD1 subclass zinc finger protein